MTPLPSEFRSMESVWPAFERMGQMSFSYYLRDAQLRNVSRMRSPVPVPAPHSPQPILEAAWGFAYVTDTWVFRTKRSIS